MFSDFAESQYEQERRQRIEENKKMLAKLFPNGTALNINNRQSPKKSPPAKQRRSTIAFPIRRNPRRKARSYDFDFLDEEENAESLNDAPRTFIKIRGPLTEHLFRRAPSSDAGSSDLDSEDESSPERRRKRPTKSRRAAPKPLVEVSEEDLVLVAERVADKRYDSENGTSCHQCRQKTDDLKTACKSDACVGIRGQFCGPCLRNRYGEDAKAAIMDPGWVCPPCRGICNCSFCMKKRGRRCTGIMIHLAKQNGFEDVKSYLGDWVMDEFWVQDSSYPPLSRDFFRAQLSQPSTPVEHELSTQEKNGNSQNWSPN